MNRIVFAVKRRVCCVECSDPMANQSVSETLRDAGQRARSYPNWCRFILPPHHEDIYIALQCVVSRANARNMRDVYHGYAHSKAEHTARIDPKIYNLLEKPVGGPD
jgi:hypothetical protein